MSDPQPPARLAHRPTGVATLLTAVFTGLVLTAQGCTSNRTASTGTLSVQAAVAELEQGRARGSLRLTGVVTDDDPAADLTLIADESRGLVVHRADWQARPKPGSRVVLEGQLRMAEGTIPTLTASHVVSV